MSPLKFIPTTLEFTFGQTFKPVICFSCNLPVSCLLQRAEVKAEWLKVNSIWEPSKTPFLTFMPVTRLGNNFKILRLLPSVAELIADWRLFLFSLEPFDFSLLLRALSGAAWIFRVLSLKISYPRMVANLGQEVIC